MPEQLGTQFDIELLAGFRIESSTQPTEGYFPKRYCDEADRKHLERGQRIMNQHLVDDILEEKRRSKAQQVERQRNQQTSPISFR